MADIQVFRYYNNGDYHDVVSYTSATHEEGLDGTDKLTITCKEAMRKRAHLLWQDELHKWHEHIVVSSVRKHNRRKVEKTYVCSNSVDELYLTLAEGTVLKGTVSQIMNKLVANTRWTSSGNDAFGGEVFELETWHKNVRECITELIDMCGGEINTWIMCGDYGVEKRIVRILEERNNERGEIPMRQFTYGKNMVDVQRTLSPDEVYTAIVGYGKKKLEIELEAKDPDTMTDEERDSYNEQLAAARENPYLERLSVTVKSSASVDKYGVMGADGAMGHSWMSYTDDECSDAAFLRKQCETLIDVYSKPLITYDFDVYQLEDDRWKYVKLGNYVHVVDDEMQFDSIERISYMKRELKGRDSCRISIGKRINPIVEKFKAEEKKERKTSGNTTKTAATKHVTTQNNYQATRPSTYTPTGSANYGGATTSDKWVHQVDGVTQAIGTINFITTPSNSGSSENGSGS